MEQINRKTPNFAYGNFPYPQIFKDLKGGNREE